MKVLNTTFLCLNVTLLMKCGQTTDYVTSMELELSPIEIINPPETSRTYSSSWYNCCLSHSLSMIDSERAWVAGGFGQDEWVQIDLGSVKEFDGL
jgi:hypothetical protein